VSTTQQGVDLTVETVDGSWGMGESDRRLPAARTGVRLTNDSQMRLEPSSAAAESVDTGIEAWLDAPSSWPNLDRSTSADFSTLLN